MKSLLRANWKRLGLIASGLVLPMGCASRGPVSSTTQPAAPPYNSAMTFDVVVPADYIEHASADGRVTVKCPPGWTGQAGGNACIIMKLVCEDHLTNLSIIERGEPETHDIQALADMTCQQLKTEIPGFSLTSTEYIRISGIDCARLNFTGDSRGSHYHWQQITVLAPTHAYILTFTSPADRYDNHLATVDRMLASIKIAS